MMARYTEEQYRYARDRANALDYAQRAGYELVKSGTCYRLREHDSMVFLQDGRWFWNSRGLRGRVIEFVTAYEGKSLPEAVLAICSVCGGGVIPAPPPTRNQARTAQPEGKKEFVLPPKAPNCRRLFGYLCGTRKLDREIVRDLVKSGDIYESVRTYTDNSTGEVKEVHNAVFIGRTRGLPRSAFQRGLSSFSGKTAFKRDVTGSDPAAPFCIPGKKGTNRVVVFEAAIDAISHASIYKAAGLDYRNCDRIAQGGTEKIAALLAYLKEHPRITEVWIAYDEDEAGEIAWERAEAVMPDGITARRLHQHCGNDWNDCLRLWREIADRERPRLRGRLNIFFLGDGNAIATLKRCPDFTTYQNEVVNALENGERIIAIK